MLTGKQFKRAFISGANNILNHRKDVDALNVFPVPDGDTGTNMSMTSSAAVRELQVVSDDEDLSIVAAKTAAALLRGARGNSGVILSLVFRGISNGFKGKKEVGGKDLAAALTLGKESAYKAVMKPTEGTILTVVRKAAAAAEALALDDCGAVLDEAYRAAQEALAETPELLPVLKEAGVVDAGGQGFLYILDGIRGYINEGKFIESNDDASPAKSNAEESKSVVAAASGDIKYGYCSEFLITKSKNPESTPLKLKAYLESIGDCVVVVDDDDIVKVHVHSNEPGNVIQAALKIGPLINIKIDNMRYQHANADVGIDAKKDNKEENLSRDTEINRVQPTKDYGFVAVAAGDGMAELFKELGCDVVVSGGQTMNPSTEDMLRAIEEVNAETILAADIPKLQSLGMTFRKAEYITDFAQKVHSGAFNLDAVWQMSDEDAIRELSSLKGIGVWTAEMILLFCMQRPNIFSYDDLAIQRGLRMVYHHREIDRKRFERYRKRFSPYCSVASLYLWAVSGGAILGMKDYK